MLNSVRSLIRDVERILDIAEQTSHAPLRVTLSHTAQTTLQEAAALLAEPPKRKYTLPKAVVKPEALRPTFTPWARKKSDYDAFRSEILSFLRGAAPQRHHKANLAETAKLWSMFKENGSLDEVIQCAKAEVTNAEQAVTRLRSMSEESDT